MKIKTRILCLLLFCLVAMGTWYLINLSAKNKYNSLRSKIVDQILTTTPMDEKSMAIYQHAKTHWTQRQLKDNKTNAYALQTINLGPTVLNIVMLLSSRIPEYSYFSMESNARASEIGALQAIIVPATLDQKIHLSADNNLAMLRISTNYIMVFRNTEEGLIEEDYYLPSGNTKAQQKVN